MHGDDPVQARRMDLRDIDDLRRWHRQAVGRSLQAGYDLVYVYAGARADASSSTSCRARYNDRTDEYGGSLENRARLLREILEDTLEEVDGRAAVACRICVDELVGEAGSSRGEIEEVLGISASCPTCGTSWSASGTSTRSRRGSPTRARRRSTCAASSG